MLDWFQKMSDKIELKEKLAAVDQNVRELWDAMEPDQQKSLKGEFFLLNRYVSSVANQPRHIQEHYVLTVNEYFNKHWASLQDHPKLLWMLLCMCGHESRKVFYHEWIGHKKKAGNLTKKIKLLEDLYPNKKMDEVELLASMSTDKDLKELCRAHGIDEATIAKRLK
jgi:phosphoenolpyruvate synthase/pyruvate phosphate dikinase